jgi:hypothetical protein
MTRATVAATILAKLRVECDSVRDLPHLGRERQHGTARQWLRMEFGLTWGSGAERELISELSQRGAAPQSRPKRGRKLERRVQCTLGLNPVHLESFVGDVLAELVAIFRPSRYDLRVRSELTQQRFEMVAKGIGQPALQDPGNAVSFASRVQRSSNRCLREQLDSCRECDHGLVVVAREQAAARTVNEQHDWAEPPLCYPITKGEVHRPVDILLNRRFRHSECVKLESDQLKLAMPEVQEVNDDR